MMPAPAIGTFTRNTDPHQKWLKSQPPAIGPAATPNPVVPDQMPIARARAPSSVNTLVSIDSVEGMIPAAPMPMQARVATRWSGVPANAEPAEPAAKMASPARKVHLRPSRSPVLPRTRSRPAKTTA